MSRQSQTIISVLSFIALFIWAVVLSIPDDNVRIVACDVGQGDALLITHRHTQVLIDGGPSKKVLSCLGRHMPFWDRKLEMVILTNADRDHYYGLIEVVNRYQIGSFVATPIRRDSSVYQSLVDKVVSKNISLINPDKSDALKINDLSFDIVWPNLIGEESSVLGTQDFSEEVNELSVVFHFRYKQFDALFTGDIVPQSIDLMLLENTISDVEYLKIPHHGSKNGLTSELLQRSTPEIAVISAGNDNRYGHPHKEVIDMLESAKVKILRTDQLGDIEVVTNGETYWMME